MNDLENIAFPTGPIISDVFGSMSTEDNMMSPSDLDLHSLLDDIGFFDADVEEESMLLPTSDIQTNDSNNNFGARRISPTGYQHHPFISNANNYGGAQQQRSNDTSTAVAFSAPVFISSHDLVMSGVSSSSNDTRGLPVTVSSSSVASKGVHQPLAPPSYYLATNKFAAAGLQLAPMPVSPVVSGRPLVVPTPCPIKTGPATVALAALAARPVSEPDTDASGSNGKKRRFSDVTSLSSNSDTWITEEEMEMRRERNRVHAKKSRQRKKCLTHTLEDSLEALKEENAKLRESIYQVIGKAKTNEILEKRTMDEHYRFIDSVKSCRVIDKKTATFLRGLRKKMQAANKKREQRERK